MVVDVHGGLVEGDRSRNFGVGAMIRRSGGTGRCCRCLGRGGARIVIVLAGEVVEEVCFGIATVIEEGCRVGD